MTLDTLTQTALVTLALAACARDSRTTTPAPAATLSTPTVSAPPPQMDAPPHEQATRSENLQQTTELTAFIDPGAQTQRPVMEAMAVIHSNTGDRLGTVRFVRAGETGLDVVTELDRLPPGVHAYHVHVYGDCSSSDFKSAGPRFHVTGSSFEDDVDVATGTLGELSPMDDGRAKQYGRLLDARLHGPFSLIGRAVVFHAQPDDPSITLEGAAGARIACGVIGIGNPEPSELRPPRSAVR